MYMCVYTHTHATPTYICVCAICCVWRGAQFHAAGQKPMVKRNAPPASHPGRAAARLGPGTLQRCGQLVPGSPAVLPRPRRSSLPSPRSKGCGPSRAGAGRRCRRTGRSAGAEGALDGQVRAVPAAIASSLSPQAAARRASWRAPRPPPPAAPPRARGPARRCPRRRRRGWTCRAPSSGSASTRSARR